MENTILIIAILYGIGGLIEGFVDGRNSKAGKYIEHKFSFAIRILGSISIYLVVIPALIVVPAQISILIIPLVLLTNSIGVDFGFNYGKGERLGYIGRTSDWDKFIRKTPIGGDGILYQMTKLIGAIFLFLIIVM